MFTVDKDKVLLLPELGLEVHEFYESVLTACSDGYFTMPHDVVNGAVKRRYKFVSTCSGGARKTVFLLWRKFGRSKRIQLQDYAVPRPKCRRFKGRSIRKSSKHLYKNARVCRATGTGPVRK